MEEDYYLVLEELLLAYRSASKHKRWKRDCMSFDFNYEAELCALARQIISFSYEMRPSSCFIVSNPVYREVIAADFRDRIVHHYICAYLEPHLEPLLIEDCYSCRRGKGTSYGVNRLEHHIRSASKNYTQEAYVLQLDISAYFMSIHKPLLLGKAKKLMERIGAKVDEQGVSLHQYNKHQYILYLLEQLIMYDSYLHASYKGDPKLKTKLPKSKSLAYAAADCGLPIGNLSSQLFSNLYLNDFDHYVKRELKIKHYGRYVDDFYLIDTDPIRLRRLIPIIRDYLRDECFLSLHPNKIKLQEVRKGVNFLGFHLKPYRRYFSKSLRKRLRRKIDHLNKCSAKKHISKAEQKYLFSAYVSYLGLFRSTACNCFLDINNIEALEGLNSFKEAERR